MKFTFVRIDWEDIHSSGSWIDAKDLLRPLGVVNFGFVVYEDKKFICLSSSLPQDPSGNSTLGDCISIPKGCIVKRTPIRHKAFDVEW